MVRPDLVGLRTRWSQTVKNGSEQARGTRMTPVIAGQSEEAIRFRCWFRRQFQSPATKVPFSEVAYGEGEEGSPIWQNRRLGSSQDACEATQGRASGRRCGCGCEESSPLGWSWHGD